MAEFRLQSLVLGPVSTNVYLLQNTETKELILVDPAANSDRIRQMILKMEGRPVAILLTHGHYDHFGAAKTLREEYGVPVYIEEEDERMLEDAGMNLSGSWDKPITLKADRLVKEGDVFHLAGLEVRVMHTPGHSEGSCCYYFPEISVLFSGDTLFCMSYGRTDLPGGSGRKITESVQRLLAELPEETAVLPGHDSYTDIGQEKKYNPLAFA